MPTTQHRIFIKWMSKKDLATLFAHHLSRWSVSPVNLQTLLGNRGDVAPPLGRVPHLQTGKDAVVGHGGESHRRKHPLSQRRTDTKAKKWEDVTSANFFLQGLSQWRIFQRQCSWRDKRERVYKDMRIGWFQADMGKGGTGGNGGKPPPGGQNFLTLPLPEAPKTSPPRKKFPFPPPDG